MTREEIIQGLIGGRTRGLEIGPSHAPLFPKTDWPEVYTLDYASASELRIKYAAMGVDTAKIEEVDFVSDGRPMHEIISERAYFDFIVASNVIEHTPDFIAFFLSCELLLSPGGVLILAVPDKRYCFDAMQSVSTTGDVLQAHLDKRTRHYPGRVFDTIANLCFGNNAATWVPDASKIAVSLASHVDLAKAQFDRLAQPNCEYIDEHTWRFTPSAFRLVMQDLNYLNIVSLRQKCGVERLGFEFFLSYAFDGGGFYEHRLTLLHSMAREQVDGYNQLLNGYSVSS